MHAALHQHSATGANCDAVQCLSDCESDVWEVTHELPNPREKKQIQTQPVDKTQKGTHTRRHLWSKAQIKQRHPHDCCWPPPYRRVRQIHTDTRKRCDAKPQR